LMRPSHLLPAALLVAAGLTPASAADLTKIDRTLKDEPTYNTKSPTYCLLVFGQEAATRVWLVRDGDVMHVLASPDGKAAKKWRQVKAQYTSFALGDVVAEDGKTRYKNLRFNANTRYPRFFVMVDGRRQSAGWDRRGKLEFAAK